MGMGQNTFSFVLYDPLDYLLYPLGVERMRSLIAYKVVFEIVLSGFVFYHYLRSLKLLQLSSIIGALVFAFSGFMIVSSGWFIFSVEVLGMAFLLLGFEKLYQQNQLWIFPLPVAYLVMSRPFLLATLSIFFFLYILLRFLQQEKFNTKQYLLTMGKAAAAAIVGVMIAAPFLLEHLQIMLESPRGSGANDLSGILKATPILAFSDMLQIGTAICRTFATEILGSGNQFKGWQNIMEAPAFYCGIPCLLLIPQLLAGVNKRMRIVYGVFLLCWILPVFFPYFRYAFSFFTGDYYRSYSFYTGLVLTLLAMFGLDTILRNRQVNLPVLGGSLIVLFALLFLPYFKEDDVKDMTLVSFVSFLLLLYTLLIFTLKNQPRLSEPALLGLLVVELTYLSSITINEREILTTDDVTNRIGYNDYTVDAISYLKKQDSSFYRVDKTYYSSPAMHGSLNDAMVQGYYGTTCYHSFNQKYYIQYLKALGVIGTDSETETRWAAGLAGRIIPEGINSVKYVLSKTKLDPFIRLGFDSIAQFGDVTVYRHKYNMPLGFAYHKVFTLSDFSKCSMSQKDFMSMRAAVVSDSNLSMFAALPRISLADTVDPNLFAYEYLSGLRDTLLTEVFQCKQMKPTLISGSITLNKPGIVYFSIPFDKGWQITDNGSTSVSTCLIANGMTGIYLDKGNHNLQFAFEQVQANRGKKLTFAGCFLFLLLIGFSVKYRRHAA
jgi:hypothetical protein